MGIFLGLPFPRMFMYGGLNNGLSYQPTLQVNGWKAIDHEAINHGPSGRKKAAKLKQFKS